jgi:hypothetical protein
MILVLAIALSRWCCRYPRRLRVATVAVLIAATITSVIAPRSTIVAADAFQGGNEGVGVDGRTSDQSRGARRGNFGDKAGVRELLREGTLIPATEGRVIVVGRRWAFVPGKAPAGPASASAGLDATIATEPVGGDPSAPQPEKTQASKLPQMLVVENLMLQRMLDASPPGQTESRWVVTGEVTEFRGENRLWIRTAQRPQPE